jgi:hypothetical protein
MHWNSWTTAAFLILIAAASAKAAPLVGYDFDQTGPRNNVYYTSGTPETLGMVFVPHETIEVTALGFFDYQRNGLAQARTVGIFHEATRALVASAIVPGGTSGQLVGDFRYTSIAPVALSAGETYIVAGFQPGNRNPPHAEFLPFEVTNLVLNDPLFDDDGFVEVLAFHPLLTFRGADWAVGPNQLTYPDDNLSLGEYSTFFYVPAANFQFQTLAAETPEPSTICLWVAIAGLAAVRLRRFRGAVS